LGVLVAYALGREVTTTPEGGLWTALYTAVTPWHVHFSRWCEQAIVLSVVYSAAVLFLIRLARRRTLTDAIAAGVLLAAGAYAYSPGRLLVAGSGVAYALFAWRRGWMRSRAFAAFALAFAAAVVPFVVFYATHAGAMDVRFQRIRIPVTEVPAAYLSHFDPRFLFGRGDADIRLAPRSAMLPWYLGPLALAGGWMAAARRSRVGLTLAGIVVFTPALGALTHHYPHASRTITLLPFVQVLAAVGTLAAVRGAVRPGSALVRTGLLAVVAVGLVLFGHQYWDVYRYRARGEWHHGLLRALEYAAARADVDVYAPPAHYADWMLASGPDAAAIVAHREALRAGQDVYDPLDNAGKYNFVRPFARVGRRARLAWDPAHPPPGLWVVEMDDLPAGFSAPCVFRAGGYCAALVPPVSPSSP
jgi:hypothetical protein